MSAESEITAEERHALDELADGALADEALMKRAVAEAVAGGALVDCTEDVDHYWWVALSRAAYEDCVAWTDGAGYWRERHEQMRMRHVADMLLHAGRVHHDDGAVAPVQILRIPRAGDTPELQQLMMHVHDNWLIVTLPGEPDPLAS